MAAEEAATVVDRLERNLMSLGVYVERHALEVPDGVGDETDDEADEDPTLHVEYETAAGGLTGGDVGSVCTELVDAHRDGWEPVDCRFWVFETDGGYLGDWAVSAGWFRALERGDVSETDFSTLVLSTRQPAEEPPSPVPAWGSASSKR